MYQVVKRDGEIVDFSIGKISAAITKAFDAIGKSNISNTVFIICRTFGYIFREFGNILLKQAKCK